MAKMNSKFKYMLDAAPSITFRNGAAAALTATANTNAIALDQLDGYWNTQGELADTTFAIVVNVNAIDTTSDETYLLELEAGPVGFGSSIKTHRLPVNKTGQYVMLVDIDTIKHMKADVAALRIAATLGGTTPSLDFTAFIAGAIIR